MRRLCFVLALVGSGVVVGSSHGVAAQGVLPSRYPEDASSLSTELRFRLFTTAYRWSSYRSLSLDLPDSAKRSLYAVPAIGARFYPKNRHGALVDLQWRMDIDVDSSASFICIFECPPQWWTEFFVAHIGYAYRYAIPGPRKPGRIAWTVTPHASLSAGASFSTGSGILEFLREQSPVVGARFGVDLDLHINRFFMGWTLRYEFLKHTRGGIGVSHFLSWNVIPVFAIGGVIGGKVQAQGR